MPRHALEHAVIDVAQRERDIETEPRELRTPRANDRLPGIAVRHGQRSDVRHAGLQVDSLRRIRLRAE
jgi:hypothetical protein